MKKFLSFLCVFLLILTLVFPMATVNGMNNGIKICLYTLIPSFFPFLLITNIMIKYDFVKYISNLLAPILGKLFGVSACGSFVVFIGFTCGYPMGVKTARDLLENGSISKKEFLYLIKFCNNPSLSFTINYVCCSLLNNECNVTKILVCIYGASILTGILLNITNTASDTNIDVPDFKDTPELKKKNMNVFVNSIKTLISISSYVLIFSTLTELMKVIYYNTSLPYHIVITFTEITSGLNYFSATHNLSDYLSLVIIALISGGASITAQTLSFLNKKEEITSYAAGKLICITISLFLYFILIK